MEDLISQLEQRIRNLEERVAKVEAGPATAPPAQGTPALTRGTVVRVVKGKNAGLTGPARWIGTNDWGKLRVGISVPGQEKLSYADVANVEVVQ